MRVFVAGHAGMAGTAFVRRLRRNISVGEIITRTRAELDLLDQQAVHAFLSGLRPDAVILAAARVGGIRANNEFPAAFIYENLVIQTNVIHGAYLAGVRRLLFLGSSCIYPRLAEQPMTEEALLRGALEPTNEPYALAKIAGIKLCESYNRQFSTDYRAVMPTNLYGPGDNFHPENSHVIPALMRRFHEAKMTGAKEVVVWGSGSPRREFLHVDDMVDGALFVFGLSGDTYRSVTATTRSHLNLGSGTDVSIRELATLMQRVVGFAGRIVFDASKQDGAPRKLLDVSRMRGLGWQARTSLEDGLRDTYAWYVKALEGGDVRVG